MRKLRSVSWFLVLTLAGCEAWCAQDSSKEPSQTADYSQEAVVIELLSQKAEFGNDGTANFETTFRARVQSDAGVKQYGLLIFQYQQANDTLEISFVRVRKPDGSVVITPAGNIQDLPADVSREAPFYSDVRQKHVAVRGLSEGDTLEYQIRSRTHTPSVPGHFWLVEDFIRDAIVLEEALEVTVPADRHVRTKFPALQPTVTEEAGRRIYRWKTANLERSNEEDSTVAADEQPPPAVQFTTFRSYEEVGRWYDSLQRERVKPTPEIRAQAAELTHDAANDVERLKAIYNFVALKFRYIGIAFGIGRYQPNAAADVLANQYGDCKDKHTLLASLLKAAGVPAYPALINANRTTDPDMPSPAQFDHVITAVPQGEDYIWLDTTAEVAPFGYLVPSLRKKDALVISESGPPALVRTPSESPFPNLLRFQVEGKLDDKGTLEARIERAHRGDVEVILRTAFRRTPRTQWKDVVQQISYASGFGGTVDNIEVSPPEATDAPFRLAYDYNRKDYPDWDNRRITMPCPPFGLPALKDKDEETRKKLKLGQQVEFVYEGRVTLPAGYVPQLPSPVELELDFAEYYSTYEFKDGALQSRRRLIIKTEEIPAEEFVAYRAFSESANADERRFIRLESAGEAAARSRDPEADKLFQKGLEAMKRMELRSALERFKKSVELAPDYPNAWTAIGSIHMQLREFDEGLKAFHKAVEVTPEDSRAHKLLGFALMQLGRTDEAIQVWEDLQKRAPDDRDAPANLGAALLHAKRYKEAVPVLQKAAELNPSSHVVNFQLGYACLQTGETEQAIPAFQKAAELDPSPPTWNNIAYNLATKDVNLPEALRYAELAVKAREEETIKLTLDRVQVNDLRVISSLGASWDTLGYVHFRLGDIEVAERYVSAAWSLSQHPEQADHLGQIFEKQGKKSAAIRAYAWALALHENRPETRNRLSNLAGSQAQVQSAIGRAREEVSQLRTVKLGPIVSKQVTAEFFVLISQDSGVEGVKFIGGDEELRDAAKDIAKARFDVLFPSERPTRILRRGILMCHSLNPGCEFVLLTPDSVHSVN